MKRRVQRGVMLEMVSEEVELPDGRRAALDLIRHPGAAAVVPFLSDEEILLIRQYRYAAGGEIYVPSGKATALWQALMAHGEDLGVGPAGLGARDTLRLESAYCLYGNDIDRTTTPLVSRPRSSFPPVA